MVSVEQAKNEIKNGIRAYLRKDKNGNYLGEKFFQMPFFLYGNPGIGKTRIVEQIAKELGLGYVSFSLTHHTRNTLLGLPVIKNLSEGQYTEFTMSEILAAVLKEKEKEKGQAEGILLLDEFNCASESVMPTMLGFLQTGTIGAYTLPMGWVMVLCGNPREYNKSAREFDSAIMDRVRLLPMEYNAEEFIEYAKNHDFHPAVTSYLEHHPDQTYFSDKDHPGQLVTCRSWENLSKTLLAYEAEKLDVTPSTIEQYLKAPEIASNFFRQYWLYFQKLEKKDIEAILAGKRCKEIAADVKAQSFEYSFRLAQFLVKEIIARKRAGASPDTASLMISNVYHFLELLPQCRQLLDQYYNTINASDDLLLTLNKRENKEYLSMVAKAYAV